MASWILNLKVLELKITTRPCEIEFVTFTAFLKLIVGKLKALLESLNHIFLG
jgi:hypothetical protein